MFNEATHRLVHFDMLYQRQLGRIFDCVIHWSIDNPPQGGYTCMVTMEECCHFSPERPIGDRLQSAPDFVVRHLPVVTLGWGAPSLTYKTAGAHHALAVETGSWDVFCKARNEIRSFTSVGGLEQDLPDAPCLFD